MPSHDEIREQLRIFKQDNPHVDWDSFEPYAVQDQNTGEVVRMGYTRRDRIQGAQGEEIR